MKIFNHFLYVWLSESTKLDGFNIVNTLFSNAPLPSELIALVDFVYYLLELSVLSSQ